MKDVYREWDALCKEFEAARDAQFAAYAAVTRGFADAAKGTGGNPTEEELDSYEQTSQKLEDVLQRMDAFVKANT